MNIDLLQRIWKEDAEAVHAQGEHRLPDGRLWVPREVSDGRNLPVGTVRVDRAGGWQEVVEVPIEKLQSQQDRLYAKGVSMHTEERGWEKAYPVVEKEGDHFLIDDGHHRVQAAKDSGVKSMKVWLRLPGGTDDYRKALESLGRDSAQIPKAVMGSVVSKFPMSPGKHDVKCGDASLSYEVVPIKKHVELYSLRVPQRKRRKGAGRAAMEGLLAAADEANLKVTLLAASLDDRTSQKRLVEFYRGLGFVETGFRGNTLGDPFMEREPVPVAAPAEKQARFLTEQEVRDVASGKIDPKTIQLGIRDEGGMLPLSDWVRRQASGETCTCGHPASSHSQPPDFGCKEEKNGCKCLGFTTQKTAAKPFANYINDVYGMDVWATYGRIHAIAGPEGKRTPCGSLLYTAWRKKPVVDVALVEMTKEAEKQGIEAGMLQALQEQYPGTTLNEKYMERRVKTASPDFGYSRYNDREKELRKVKFQSEYNEYSGTLGVVAKFQHKDIGFLYCLVEDGTCEVSEAEIQPEWRGTGIGQMLYDRALVEAKKIGCVSFFSDKTLSDDANRAWGRIKRRYPVVAIENTEGGPDEASVYYKIDLTKLPTKTSSPDFGYSRYNESKQQALRKLQIVSHPLGDYLIEIDALRPGTSLLAGDLEGYVTAEAKGPDRAVKSFTVTRSDIKDEWKGTGLGQMLYDKLIEVAKARGAKRLYSDESLSREGIAAWKRLAQRYPVVELHGEAMQTDEDDENGLNKVISRYVIDLTKVPAKAAFLQPKEAKLPPVEKDKELIASQLDEIHQRLAGMDPAQMQDATLIRLFEEVSWGTITLDMGGKPLPKDHMVSLHMAVKGGHFDPRNHVITINVASGSGKAIQLAAKNDPEQWKLFADAVTELLVHERTHLHQCRAVHRDSETGLPAKERERMLNDSYTVPEKVKVDGREFLDRESYKKYLSHHMEIAAWARKAVEEVRNRVTYSGSRYSNVNIYDMLKRQSAWGQLSTLSASFREFYRMFYLGGVMKPAKERKADAEVFRNFIEQMVKALPPEDHQPVSKQEHDIMEELSPSKFKASAKFLRKASPAEECPGVDTRGNNCVQPDEKVGKTASYFPSFEDFVKAEGGIHHLVDRYDAYSYYSYPLSTTGEDDWEELSPEEKQERVLEVADEELEGRYEEVLWEHRNLKFPLSVYRAVDIKGDVETSLRTEGIGIYWTWDLNSAEAHWSNGGKTYILKATIQSEDVDWVGTLGANMDPRTGDAEKEIRLQDGVQVRVVGYQPKKGLVDAPGKWLPLPQGSMVTASTELPLWDGDGKNGVFPGWEPGGKLSKVTQIPVSQIEKTEEDSRLDRPTLERLMYALQFDDGQEIPAVIVEEAHDGKYDLVDGHHRFEAAKRVGYKEIPARIWTHPEHLRATQSKLSSNSIGEQGIRKQESSSAAISEDEYLARPIYRRNTRTPNPDNGVGFTMWKESKDGEEEGLNGYGKYRWEMTPAKTVSSEELRDMIRDKFIQDYRDRKLSPELETMLDTIGADEEGNADAFLGEMSPEHIVTHAGAFDNKEFMTWLWDNYESVLKDTSITTPDGLVTFTHDAEAKPWLPYEEYRKKTAGSDLDDRLDAFTQDLWSHLSPNPNNDREGIWESKVGIQAEQRWGRIQVEGIHSLEEKQGYGTKALEFLKALADKYGVELEVHPVPFGSAGLKQPELRAWYVRHGFVNERAGEYVYKPKKLGDKQAAASSDITDTPAFKAWFGASKIVEKNGKPMTVYHGTKETFEEFRTSHDGLIYFTPDPHLASSFATNRGHQEEVGEGASQLIPCYLRVVNPFDPRDGEAGRILQKFTGTDSNDGDFGAYDAYQDSRLVRAVHAAGYDGIWMKEGVEYDTVAVFSPQQIKSAIGNGGNFDPNDNRITASSEQPKTAAPNTSYNTEAGETMTR